MYKSNDKSSNIFMNLSDAVIDEAVKAEMTEGEGTSNRRGGMGYNEKMSQMKKKSILVCWIKAIKR